METMHVPEKIHMPKFVAQKLVSRTRRTYTAQALREKSPSQKINFRTEPHTLLEL